MAKKERSPVKASKAATQGNETTPGRSGEIAERGITHGYQFAELMSAMMSDLVTGKMTPAVANATCNAGGKLLKIVEMQIKYGGGESGAKEGFRLTGPRA